MIFYYSKIILLNNILFITSLWTGVHSLFPWIRIRSYKLHKWIKFDASRGLFKYLIASMFIFPRRTRIRFGSVQIGLDMVHGERFWFFQLFARSYQEYYPLIIPPPPGPEDLGISSDWTYLKIARLSQFLIFQDPQSYSGSLRYGCKTGSQMINK